MQGGIVSLAEALQISPLAVKEQKNGKSGFYTAGADLKKPEKALIPFVRQGVFVNFYPENSWYEKEALRFAQICALPLSNFSDRSEAVSESLKRCACYAGEKAPEITKILDFTAKDGAVYNCVSPGAKRPEYEEFTKHDPAFYLSGAYEFAQNASGEQLKLTDNGKRLINAMSFLEPDILRTLHRKDPSVLYKRAEKCVGLYFDYYYDIKEKGLISKAFTGFLSTVLYLLASDALSYGGFAL